MRFLLRLILGLSLGLCSQLLLNAWMPAAILATPRPCSENPDADGDCLLSQGIEQYDQGQLTEALDLFERALKLYQQDSDQTGEADALNNLGETYRSLSQYAQALASLDRALIAMQRLGNTCPMISRQRALGIRCNPRQGEAAVLHNLSLVYEDLGQMQRAEELSDQATALEAGLAPLQTGVLTARGGRDYYHSLLHLALRLSGDQQCYPPDQDVTAKIEQDSELSNWLNVFDLRLLEVGNRQDAATLWRMRGQLYEFKGYCEAAFAQYQQALIIFQEVGNQAGASYELGNLARILEKQDQFDLAIVFYKQAVNIQEEIRRNIQGLPSNVQQSYLNKISQIYRSLADLLLAKGRILEAQGVLELLKIQELREYTRSSVIDVGNRKIIFTSAESNVLAKYNSLIAFGVQIYSCEQSHATCSAAQLEQLYQARMLLNTEYQEAIRSFEQEIRSRNAQDPAFLDPAQFSGEAQDILQNTKSPTVLIYPVVLDDRLWILWATIGGDKSVLTNAIEVSISREALSQEVVEFRQLMEACEIQPCGREDIPAVQAVAQRLYHILMPPQLVAELERNQIENLVFSLDRVTRYIPVAALFDGQQYLIQRYTVSTILAAGLTRQDNPLAPGTGNTSVLAFGLSDPVPPDPAENLPEFRALPNVPTELAAIVQQGSTGIYPGQILLNQAFDLTALANLPPRYQILHIATHGQFIPASLDQSYLLLGTKKPLRISQIENLQPSFSGLSLVVLSACQTALGEAGEDGIEIAGVAHSFIEAGVNTVLASLWQVEDRSTSILMQLFYQNLAEPTSEDVAISQALRQAQLSLIDGRVASDSSLARASGASIRVESTARDNGEDDGESAATPEYAHPYYWAPFILIGDG